MPRDKFFHIGRGDMGQPGRGEAFRVNEFEMKLLERIMEVDGYESMAEAFRALVREAAERRCLTAWQQIDSQCSPAGFEGQTAAGNDDRRGNE